MGAWGCNSFENDDAMMWADDCVNSRDPSAFIRRSLSRISADPDAIDSRRAIAAAELIAKARGHGAREFPEELHVWIQESGFKPPAGLKTLAIRAVTSIREKSELRELWRGNSSWSASCRRLLERLDRSSRKAVQRRRKKSAVKQNVTTDDQNSITRFIRENGGFVNFLERKPFSVGFDAKCRVPKQLLEAFGRLPTVEEVTVYGASRRLKLRADWLKPLVGLPNLRRVELTHCKLGDNHLQVLGEITNLCFLSVFFCPDISDRGLRYLSKCKALEILEVGNTNVTAKGIAKLERALPRLRDIRD